MGDILALIWAALCLAVIVATAIGALDKDN